jgi:hypothetical protein
LLCPADYKNPGAMGEAGISVSATCYRGDFIGFLLYWLVGFFTARLWGGYAWYASRTGSLYFAIGSAMSMLTVAMQYCLAVLYDPHDPVPYSTLNLSTFECRSEYGGLNPDLLTALIYHYWILGLSHELYIVKKMESPVATSLSSLAYLLGCPAIIFFNSNSSLLNLLFGALLGISCGLIACAVTTFVLVPRQGEVAEYTKYAGYVNHALSDFRVIN